MDASHPSHNQSPELHNRIDPKDAITWGEMTKKEYPIRNFSLLDTIDLPDTLIQLR